METDANKRRRIVAETNRALVSRSSAMRLASASSSYTESEANALSVALRLTVTLVRCFCLFVVCTCSVRLQAPIRARVPSFLQELDGKHFAVGSAERYKGYSASACGKRCACDSPEDPSVPVVWATTSRLYVGAAQECLDTAALSRYRHSWKCLAT